MELSTIHPLSIRPLRTELMASTALTPTYHKSKGISAIIGIVGSIAIPFAAPYIASSLMASMSIAGAAGSFAATASSALVGAALGAGVTYAAGGRGAKNLLLGAAGGGIAGGIAGYNAGPLGAGSGVGFGSNVSLGQVASNVAAPGQPGLTSNLVGNTGSDTLSAVSSSGASGDSFIPSYHNVDGTSAIYPNWSYSPDGSGTFNYAAGGARTAGANTFVPQLHNVDGTSAIYSDWGYNPDGGFNYRTGYGPANTTAASSGINALGQQQTANFIDKAMTSPAMKDAASKLATMGVSNLAASGEPNMTDAERELLAQQRKARAFEQAQLAKKSGRADAAYREAMNINPENKMRESIIQQRTALGIQARNALRRLPTQRPGETASTRRKYDLASSRVSGVPAYNTAQNQRRAGISAAMGMSPTGANYADNLGSDAKDSAEYYKRKEKEYNDYAGIFEPLAADIFSTDSAAERERKRKEASKGAVS